MFAFSFLQKENRGSDQCLHWSQQHPTGVLHLRSSTPWPSAKEKVQHRMVLDFFWQGHKDLNPEPTVLETAALPIELYPYVNIKGGERPYFLWWALRDSNPGLSGYEPEALTN